MSLALYYCFRQSDPFCCVLFSFFSAQTPKTRPERLLDGLKDRNGVGFSVW